MSTFHDHSGSQLPEDPGVTRYNESLSGFLPISETELRSRRSEERNRSLIATSAQIVWFTNAGGLVEEDMPTWRLYSGQSSAEIKGLGWLEAVHPDERQMAIEHWQRSTESDSFYEAEYRLRRHDGVYHTFWVRGVPVLERDGGTREWVGTCTNISDHKRLEEALMRSADEATLRASQLEAIFDAVAEALFVYDQHGQILRTNTAARALLGQKDTLANYYNRDYTERVSDFLPRDEEGQPLPRERWPLVRILRGEVLKDESAADIVLRLSYGESGRFVDRQMNIIGTPVRDEEGTIIGAVTLMHDVTERRRLERRTQESLTALLAMAETLVQPFSSARAVAADDPILKDSQRVHADAERLAELACSVLACKRVALIAVDPLTHQMQPLAAVGLEQAADADWRQEIAQSLLSDYSDAESLARLRADEILNRDLLLSPFAGRSSFGIRHLVVAPMLSAGLLIGILALEPDASVQEYPASERALIRGVARLATLITERERLLAEHAESLANELVLREGHKRMNEFLSIASHELKTPLTTIKGNVQLAKRQLRNLVVTGPEQISKLELVQELLSRADRQVGLLNRLVRDLLDSTRIQSSNFSMKMEFHDLVAIVQRCVADLQPTAPQRALNVHVENGWLESMSVMRPIIVQVDAEGIGLVLTNYLTNALKYSPKDQAVEISVFVEGQQARVAVHDEGPGLPLVEQSRIWERFYRAPDSEGTHSAPGLGLGLHICKMVIELHQGAVGVESTPGQGATFWFTIPLAQTSEPI